MNPTPTPRPANPPPLRPGGWAARYDRKALRPPDVLPPEQTQSLQRHPAWPALWGWCLHGSGRDARRHAPPGTPPAMAETFTIAHLQGHDIRGLRALATALCLERDGSLQLQACRTALGRLQLRVATKLHDKMWWRARQPTDAWDCGDVIDTPAGLQALSQFVPRRATLVVADMLTAATLHLVIHGLRALAPTFRQPVRLLVLGPLPAAQSGAVRLIDVDRSL